MIVACDLRFQIRISLRSVLIRGLFVPIEALLLQHEFASNIRMVFCAVLAQTRAPNSERSLRHDLPASASKDFYASFPQSRVEVLESLSSPQLVMTMKR